MDYSCNFPVSTAGKGNQECSVSCTIPTIKGKKMQQAGNKSKIALMHEEQPLRVKISIQDLPNNILRLIFSYLDARQRFRIELVCRKWRLIGKLLPWLNPTSLLFTPDIQCSSLRIPSHELTDHILLALLSRCGACLKELLFWFRPIDYVIITSRSLSMLGKSCPNLEKLILCSVPIDVGTLTAVANRCHKLKEICLYDTKKSDFGAGVLSIMQCCQSLETVTVSEVLLTDDWFKVVNPKLKNVSLDLCSISPSTPLQNLITRCDSLEVLSFSFGCYLSIYEVNSLFNIFNHFKTTLKELSVTGGLLKAVNWCDGLKNLHHLQALSLTCTKSIDDKLITCIVQECPKLESLVIPGCTITDRGAVSLEALPLKTLDVSCANNISDDGLRFICKKGMLVSCSLSLMIKITEDFCCSLAGTCPNLRDFDVSANGKKITNRVVNAFRLAIKRKFLKPPVLLTVGCTDVSRQVKRCAGLGVMFTSEYEEAFEKGRLKKSLNSSRLRKK